MKSLELYVPLVYRIEGSHLVDSLPYIDEYTEADKKLVRDLIEAEQKTFPAKDYLEHYNTIDKEFLEIKGFVPFDFKLKTPEFETDYIESVTKNKIAIEYLESQKMNLELLNEFSKESWNKHIETLEAYEKKLDSDIKKLEQHNLEINKSRKIAQEQSKAEIKTLEEQWKILIGKNALVNRKLTEKQEYLNKISDHKLF